MQRAGEAVRSALRETGDSGHEAVIEAVDGNLVEIMASSDNEQR